MLGCVVTRDRCVGFAVVCFLIALPLPSVLYATQITVACRNYWADQFQASLAVARTVEETCISQNRRLEARGFPSCGTFCTEKIERLLEGGKFTLEVEFRVSNGSSPASSFGGTYNPATGGGLSSYPPSSGGSSSSGRTNVSVALKLKFEVPLGPTDKLSCINPLFSAGVTDLSRKLLSTPWLDEGFALACRQRR